MIERPDWEVLPLLDAVGDKGMYIMTSFESAAQADEMAKRLSPAARLAPALLHVSPDGALHRQRD
jgi:hypothetical protein